MVTSISSVGNFKHVRLIRRTVLVITAMFSVLLVYAGAALAQTSTNGKIAFSAYQDGNYEIYTMDQDGLNRTNITQDSAFDNDPAFSPDGKKIAFTREHGAHPGANPEIYVMNSDGSNQTRLTNNSAPDGEPLFSPDGTKIVFTSYRDGGNPEIYMMDLDGSNPANLTNSSTSDQHPAFSPDGTKIAFTSYRDGNWDIYVMNPNGSDQARLTTNNSLNEAHPTFSPDGTKIAFDAYLGSGTGWEVYGMNSAGSDPTKLTDNSVNDEKPSFSPDGTKIAFMSAIDGSGYYEIYTMKPDGTDKVRLTNTPETSEYDPNWGPAVELDKTAPDSTISSGPSANTNETSASFVFTSTEEGSTFECSLDGAAFSSCSSPKDYTGLAEGSHIFEVRATDAAGNADATPAKQSWSVDTTAPDTTIDSGPSGLTSKSTASFTFSSGETGSTFECSLDGGEFAQCESGVSYNDLADGDHVFQVRATDQAGNKNQTPAEWTFTVDATAPTVTVSPANATTAPKTTNVIATFDEEMDEASINSGSLKLEKVTTDKRGTTSYTAISATFIYDPATDTKKLTLDPNRNLSNGNYRVTVSGGAKDKAGNALGQDHISYFKVGR